MSIKQENSNPLEVRAIEGFIHLIKSIYDFTEFKVKLSNNEELQLKRNDNDSYSLVNVKSSSRNTIAEFRDFEDAIEGLEQIKSWDLQLVPEYLSRALCESSYWDTFKLRRSIYLHIDKQGNIVETLFPEPMRPYLHINHRGDNVYELTFCSMTELTKGTVRLNDGVEPLLDWLKNRVEHRYETVWMDISGRHLSNRRDGYVPYTGDATTGESIEFDGLVYQMTTMHDYTRLTEVRHVFG